jgi:hypothetical protein
MRREAKNEGFDMAAIPITVLRITVVRHVNVRKVYREMAPKPSQEFQCRVGAECPQADPDFDGAMRFAAKQDGSVHRGLLPTPEETETPSVQRFVKSVGMEGTVNGLKIVVPFRHPFGRGI